MNFKALAASLLAASIAAVAQTPSELPKGWLRSGSDTPERNCETSADSIVRYSGQRSLTIKCTNKGKGFATVAQSIRADEVRGKRVRFSAHVKAEDVRGWSGLWMRVDKDERTSSAFDNMNNRPIKGSSDWTDYAVVLDVDKDARYVAFGILLDGGGQVWMDDIRFEPVPASVPTTAIVETLPTTPTNLDLSK